MFQIMKVKLNVLIRILREILYFFRTDYESDLQVLPLKSVRNLKAGRYSLRGGTFEERLSLSGYGFETWL